ncbi:MAG: hypothetical protein KDM91_16705 [Verrucomicrobiae bacterium]|nr:hypothetical protein [Verrucomicrobiae bacterium]MCP5549595.1 hypothetical protein [Akkermansiaceae bacterium]
MKARLTPATPRAAKMQANTLERRQLGWIVGWHRQSVSQSDFVAFLFMELDARRRLLLQKTTVTQQG